MNFNDLPDKEDHHDDKRFSEEKSKAAFSENEHQDERDRGHGQNDERYDPNSKYDLINSFPDLPPRDARDTPREAPWRSSGDRRNNGRDNY